MLADVCQSLLDDPEDLDLLVGGEVSRGVDLELDLELSIRGQEIDVAAERGVERRTAGRGGSPPATRCRCERAA